LVERWRVWREERVASQSGRSLYGTLRKKRRWSEAVGVFWKVSWEEVRRSIMRSDIGVTLVAR